MKERPIIFSSPMVRAILDGSKTQTRRVVKCIQNHKTQDGLVADYGLSSGVWKMEPGDKELWRPVGRKPEPGDWVEEWQTDVDDTRSAVVPCPYGVGQSIWVREAWGYLGCCTGSTNEMHVRYQADDSRVNVPCDSSEQVNQRALSQNIKRPANYELLSPDEKENWRTEALYKWWKSKRGIPSIHMPRWASRITLEVTGVRVERLNEISRGDAMSEGCPHTNMAAGPNPVDWFRDLWNTLNGPGSWDANPFVWVIDFRKVNP